MLKFKFKTEVDACVQVSTNGRELPTPSQQGLTVTQTLEAVRIDYKRYSEITHGSEGTNEQNN